MLQVGGHKVEKGTYWNLANGERVDIESQGNLPGDKKAKYVKMPVGVVLALAPVIGLAYAVFLPLIGIGMTLTTVGKKLGVGLLHAAVKNTTFGWRPMEAYLDGKQQKVKKAKEDRKSRKQH